MHTKTPLLKVYVLKCASFSVHCFKDSEDYLFASLPAAFVLHSFSYNS